MLEFKPHIIYVYALVEETDINNTVYSHNFSELGQGVGAMVHSLRPSVAYELTGLELEEPHSVFIEIKDMDKFKVNYKVVFNNENYLVIKPPERFSHNLPGDHARFVMAKARLEAAE